MASTLASMFSDLGNTGHLLVMLDIVINPIRCLPEELDSWKLGELEHL